MPNPFLHLCAPAKINLLLRVLGRRADHFHELRTIFVALELSDDLYIEAIDPGKQNSFAHREEIFHNLQLELVGPYASGIEVDENNLIYRAYKIYADEAGYAPKVRVLVKKNIPHGGGLGGGSSNAAAMLVALEKLRTNSVPQNELQTVDLQAMASSLGSDVAFFTHCLQQSQKTSVLARGRGEILTPLPPATNHRSPLIALIFPPFGCPTPEIYTLHAQISEKNLPGSGQFFADKLPWQRPQKIPSIGVLCNDLENAVYAKYLALADLRRWLSSLPEVAASLLSGSGSTTFAVLKSPRHAIGLQKAVHRRYGTTWKFLTTRFLR